MKYNISDYLYSVFSFYERKKNHIKGLVKKQENRSQYIVHRFIPQLVRN